MKIRLQVSTLTPTFWNRLLDNVTLALSLSTFYQRLHANFFVFRAGCTNLT